MKVQNLLAKTEVLLVCGHRAEWPDTYSYSVLMSHDGGLFERANWVKVPQLEGKGIQEFGEVGSLKPRISQL